MLCVPFSFLFVGMRERQNRCFRERSTDDLEAIGSFRAPRS
jgi:hypothetical protein